MITNWKENQYGNWRGYVIFLDDSDEYIMEEKAEQKSWYEYIFNYFF